MEIPTLDRKLLERAVAPASLHVTLASLHRNRLIRNYRIGRDTVWIDGDAVQLEVWISRLITWERS